MASLRRGGVSARRSTRPRSASSTSARRAARYLSRSKVVISKTKLLHAAQQRKAADAEDLGGAPLLAMGQAQRLLEQPALEAVEGIGPGPELERQPRVAGAGEAAPERRLARLANALGQELGPELAPARQNHRP